MVEGYRSRLGGNEVVLRAPRRAASLASALGAGISELGGAAERMAADNDRTSEAIKDSEFRIAQEEKRRARATEIAAASGRLAEMQGQIERELIEARQSAKLGGVGHEDQAKEIIERHVTDFLGTLSDDEEVRQRFEPVVRGTVERMRNAEYAYELNQRVEYQGDSFKKYLDTQVNTLRGNPNPELLTQLLTEATTLIDGFDINDNSKLAMVHSTRATLAQTMLGGMSDTGQYGAVKQLLGDGVFDDVLSPEQKTMLGRQAELGEAEAQRMAEAQASAARDAARDALETIKVKIKNGEDVPATEIQAALQAGQAAGLDQSELTEYGYLGDDAIIAGNARKLPTPQLEGEIKRLEAEAREGRLSGTDTRKLETLRDVLDARDEEKGTSLKPLLNGGVESRTAGVQQLSQMPLGERYRAADKAGDPQAAVIASLNPNAQAYAVKGGALRKDRPADFYPKVVGNRGGKPAADQLFKQILGDELVRAAGSRYAELRDTALDIMAATGGEWDENNFRAAVQVVYGRSTRADGTKQGGIGAVRGRQVELPPAWSATEFDRTYSRVAFADARYANGKEVNPEDIRQHYALRYAGEDRDGMSTYNLIGPGEKPLMHKNGTAFVLKFPRSPKVAK